MTRLNNGKQKDIMSWCCPMLNACFASSRNRHVACDSSLRAASLQSSCLIVSPLFCKMDGPLISFG